MAYEVQTLDPHQAARAYAGLHDPSGQATPETAAHAGQSFALRTPRGTLTFTTVQRGGELWIEAAAGQGADNMTAHGLALIEGMAQGAGLGSVGFQTARPGLARKAIKQGYTVAGWILKKAV